MNYATVIAKEIKNCIASALSVLAMTQKYKAFIIILSFLILIPFSINANKHSHQISIKQRSKNITIIIDPGHGGQDPGAVGKHHTLEKNVVFSISQSLYYMLKGQPGITVKMTRYSDHFVSLRQRLSTIRKAKPDLFISIHADAYWSQKSCSGLSIFALSEHGATSAMARWLARSENSAISIGGVNLEGKSYVLRSVLLNLSQTATTKNSIMIAQSIMNSAKSVTHLHTRRVEQAPFLVLKSLDTPSILIETGFLSNSFEEINLSSKIYRDRLANAIFKGIMLKVNNLR